MQASQSRRIHIHVVLGRQESLLKVRLVDRDSRFSPFELFEHVVVGLGHVTPLTKWDLLTVLLG